MKVQLQNGNLIFTLPLERPRLSASGKTRVVASSRGVQESELEIDGRPMHGNLNAFVYRTQRKKSPTYNDLKPRTGPGQCEAATSGTLHLSTFSPGKGATGEYELHFQNGRIERDNFDATWYAVKQLICG